MKLQISPLLAASIFGLMLVIFGNPLFIPDSYEQAIVAECWRFSESTRIECSEIFPFFRPPLPSLLIIPWLDWIDSFGMMLFLAWSASITFAWIVLHTLQREFPSETRLIGIMPLCMLGLAGYLSDLGLIADSKIIVLPFIFGAWSICVHPRLTGFQAGLVAFLLGLAFLTRLEALLLMALCLPIVGWKATARFSVMSTYIFVSLLIMGGWIFVLWEESQVWTISPRFWEQSLLHFLDTMPLRWLQELYGMGIWSPPMRRQIIAHWSELSLLLDSTSLLTSFSLSEWWTWFDLHILSLFHPIVVSLAGLYVLLFYQDTQLRKWWIGLLILSFPSIAITLLPQGRESILPVVYVLPLWIAVWIWIGLCTTLLFSRIENPLSKLGVLLGSIGLCLLPNSIQLPSNLELTEPGMATQHWLRTYTPKDSIVLSSFETAPIVWLSERKWQEWPSPWEMHSRLRSLQSTEQNVYGLVWIDDMHAWYSLSFEERYYEPTAYLHKAGNGFLLFTLHSPQNSED